MRRERNCTHNFRGCWGVGFSRQANGTKAEDGRDEKAFINENRLEQSPTSIAECLLFLKQEARDLFGGFPAPVAAARER